MAQTQKYIEVPKVDPKVATTEMAALRDVTTPPPVSWRPQTAGWYVLGVLLVAGAAWTAWRWFRHWQATRYRRDALAEIAALGGAFADPARRPAALRALAAIVKRTQLSERSRPEVAAVSGDDWRAQLSSGGRDGLPAQPSAVLVELSSAREERLTQMSSQEAAALSTAVSHWISRHHA